MSKDTSGTRLGNLENISVQFQCKIFLSLPPAPADHSVEEWVEAVVGTRKSIQKFLEPVVSFARAFFVYEVPEKLGLSYILSIVFMNDLYFIQLL